MGKEEKIEKMYSMTITGAKEYISSPNDDMISTTPSSMNMPSGESPDFKEDIERNMINEVVEDINSTIANLEKPSSLKLMSPSHSMSASPSPAPLKIVLSPEG